MKHPLLSAAAAAGLLLTGCQAAHPAWNDPVSVTDSASTARTRGDTAPVAWDALEAVALREPVLIQAPEPVAIPFFGRTIWLDAGTTALLGTSPDTLYAACLTGRLADGDRPTTQARGGRLLLWTPAQPAARAHAFEARHLRRSMPLADAPEVEAALAQLERQQARRVFWGNLQPTGVNAVASTPKAQNDQRAAYLQNADVVALRFNPAEPQSLARRVAERFVAALAAGDDRVAARLMSPQLGVEDTPAADAAGVSRHTLAAALAARDWSALDQAVIAQTDRPTAFRVDGAGASYRLSLTPGDGLYYVTAINRLPTTEAAAR